MRLGAEARDHPEVRDIAYGQCGDWHDDRNYAHLVGEGVQPIAWEWLRRDPCYRAHYFAARGPCSPNGGETAGSFGLCALADPDLSFATARPLFDIGIFPRVLRVLAARGGAADAIDLGRLAEEGATRLKASGGVEHWLAASRGAALRFDLVGSPEDISTFVPRFLLHGADNARILLPVLGQFLHWAKSGVLRPVPVPTNWSRRRILELRTRDALASGASQRDIAAALLDQDALGSGWRIELPSVRSRAQRLVRAARALEAGSWTMVLGKAPGAWGRAGIAPADGHGRVAPIRDSL